MSKKNEINIEQLLKKPTLPYEKFHELTKVNKHTKELDRSQWPSEWMKISYKGYSRLPETILPKPKLINGTLSQALIKRSSKREFKLFLSSQKISNLLYFAAGIKDLKTQTRFYPSAGARYPLEVYFVSINCEIPTGLYHYYVKNNSLEQIGHLNLVGLHQSLNKQEWLSSASALIIITGVFLRNTIKYGSRGYRHILTEAGCMLQNIYLLSASQNISCCAIGGYLDDKINDYLDIDGFSESVLEVIGIG
jgi:SagB-type dehydrogenase family enzyme